MEPPKICPEKSSKGKPGSSSLSAPRDTPMMEQKKPLILTSAKAAQTGSSKRKPEAEGSVLVTDATPESLSVSTSDSEDEIRKGKFDSSLVEGSPGESGNASLNNLLFDLYGFQTQSINYDELSKVASFTDQELKAAKYSLPGGSQDDSDKLETQFQLDRTNKSTLFEVHDKYVYQLGAPTSVVPLPGEDTLTYMNKGQLYSLVIEGSVDLDKVKSVVYLVFRSAHETEQLFWQYWYYMQANPNQRAFDIDRKNCENVENIEEMGLNAYSVTWSPKRGTAMLMICVNCLSTDFSAQKGVAGIPLHFLVDTYEDCEPTAEPVHRATCKIKVFRDKGAERKIKDEIRSMEKKMQKVKTESQLYEGAQSYQQHSKVTVLTPTSTLGPCPFIFVPSPVNIGGTAGSSTPVGASKTATTHLMQTIRERETKRGFSASLLHAKDEFDNLEVDPPKKKAARSSKREVLLTIYIKKEEEKVYHAIMLDSLTAHDFKLELAKKYEIPVDMASGLYKKTKKGLTVNFVDEMVEQFKDEDDYLISLEFDNHTGYVDFFVHY